MAAIRRPGYHRQTMGKTLRTIGLMSGTSLDGVDAAWLETDGERIAALDLHRSPRERVPGLELGRR